MFGQIEQLISTLESVPAAVLSSLPGYIICRAKPGLCQLMQDYTTRLEGHFALHLRTCESAIQAAIDGENPYSDWITVATGEVWKEEPMPGKPLPRLIRMPQRNVSVD